MDNLISKKDSFFVAGHNGMVGDSIIRALKRNGYCDPRNQAILHTQTRSELDLTSNEKVFEWFKKSKPQVVIIAAAKVGGILANNKYPFEFISENLKIQQNIIEASWLNGAKRLLFLGSSCIYPKFSKLPIREEELLSSYLEKTNEAYAIAKIAGIKLCEAIRKQYEFDAISLMPTNLYGPKDNYDAENSHVLAALLKKFITAKINKHKSVTCWGTGKPMREFLHVDDLADACIHVLEKWNPDDPKAPRDLDGKKLYYLNIGSGEEVSIKELANLIAKYTDFRGEILWENSKPDGTFRKNLDFSRIKSLGWKPKLSLKFGIKKLVNEIEESLNNKTDYQAYLKNF